MQSSLEMLVQQPNPSCKQNCKSGPVIHLVFGKMFLLSHPGLAWNCDSMQTGDSPALGQWLQHEGCFSKACENQMSYRDALDAPRYAGEKLEPQEWQEK